MKIINIIAGLLPSPNVELAETFFTTSSTSEREEALSDEVGKPALFPMLLAFFDIGYSSSPLKIADLNIGETLHWDRG